MHRYLFIIFLCCAGFTLAKGKELLPYGYSVKADQYSSKIKKGHYVLKGQVLHQQINEVLEGVTISKGLINVGTTDEKGQFKLTLPLADSNIRFELRDYKVTWFEHYKVQQKHVIELVVYLIPKEAPEIFNVDKPVVYAYSEQAVTACLQLITQDKLRFVWPQPDAAMTWHFTTSPSGMLNTSQGVETPYLFWESQRTEAPQLLRRNGVLQGALIERYQVVAFLESELDYLHFNARERADLITYWAPKMQQGAYVFIQFWQDEQCDPIASYTCSPQPDAFNRIYILFHVFEERPENLLIQTQTLKPMPRNGFYVVEWGGIEIPEKTLFPAP